MGETGYCFIDQFKSISQTEFQFFVTKIESSYMAENMEKVFGSQIATELKKKKTALRALFCSRISFFAFI